MANLKCTDCPYWWADEDGVRPDAPYCHYVGDDNYAPCEVTPEPARYTVSYKGYIFYGDSNGRNSHDTDDFDEAMRMYDSAGGDDGNAEIVNNEYGVYFCRGEWS